MENHEKFGFSAVWNGLMKEGKKAYVDVIVRCFPNWKQKGDKVTLYPNIQISYRAYYFFYLGYRVIL